MNTGKVMRSTGSWYEVLETVSMKTFACRLAGKMKLEHRDLTNPVAVGDVVEFEPEGETNGIIHSIGTRENYIARESPRNKHQLHLLASNVDQVLLITTLIQPHYKAGFVDRFLLLTEPQNIPVIIAFHKSDLWQEEERLFFEEQVGIYKGITRSVISTSLFDEREIKLLASLLQDKTTLISGQSGVGKSSVLNILYPQLQLKTGEISESSGKGTHTTTFAEMFSIDTGHFIIDTPGIKTLSYNNLSTMDVAHNFREFFQYSQNCKFGGACLHRNEPYCAVLQALAEGQISPIRYQNYLNILDEIEGKNYWERKKNF